MSGRGAVTEVFGRRFPGHSLWRAVQDRLKPCASHKAIEARRHNVHRLTPRCGRLGLARVIERRRHEVLGWRGGFGLVQTPRLWPEPDEWMRHRGVLRSSHQRQTRSIPPAASSTLSALACLTCPRLLEPPGAGAVPMDRRLCRWLGALRGAAGISSIGRRLIRQGRGHTRPRRNVRTGARSSRVRSVSNAKH